MNPEIKKEYRATELMMSLCTKLKDMALQCEKDDTFCRLSYHVTKHSTLAARKTLLDDDTNRQMQPTQRRRSNTLRTLSSTNFWGEI